jgi:transposase-like protein
MAQQRRSHSVDFKSKVALEAIRERKTITEIASEYQVHANQEISWKKQLLSNMDIVFSDGRKNRKENEEKESQLYQQIGQLTVELDWVKKKSRQL